MLKNRLWAFVQNISLRIPDLIKRPLTIFTIVAIRILGRYKNKSFFRARLLLSNMLPWDPLQYAKQSELDIFILTTRKDLEVLPFSIYSVLENIALENSQLSVITPERDLDNVVKIIDEHFPHSGIITRSDESVLRQFALAPSMFPNSHSLMQILKFLCVLISSSVDSVVLDGDTLFLRRRNWSTVERLVLVIPPEYVNGHVSFVERIFTDVKHFSLGYTTQSQVMRQLWVQEMIASCGGLYSFVKLFTDAMAEYLEGRSSDIFPSEWQLLGDWMLTYHRKRVVFSSYLNLSLDRSLELPRDMISGDSFIISRIFSKIESKYRNFGSVSLHAYKASSFN